MSATMSNRMHSTASRLFVAGALGLGLTAAPIGPMAARNAHATDGLGPLPHYRVITLGTLGGSAAVGFNVNTGGWVDGDSFTAGDQAIHAFVWANGHMIDV